jgi:hypothetical protein
MSHTDLGQPDLAALRFAGDAEFAKADDPLYRLGGVSLLPVPAEAGTGRGGISVSWTTHDLPLRDQRRYRTYRDTHQAINAALGRVLTAFGYQVAPFGSGGAWLVTGRRTGGTGAGQ